MVWGLSPTAWAHFQVLPCYCELDLIPAEEIRLLLLPALKLTASCHSSLSVAPLTFDKEGQLESTPASRMVFSRALV